MLDLRKNLDLGSHFGQSLILRLIPLEMLVFGKMYQEVITLICGCVTIGMCRECLGISKCLATNAMKATIFTSVEGNFNPISKVYSGRCLMCSSMMIFSVILTCKYLVAESTSYCHL